MVLYVPRYFEKGSGLQYIFSKSCRDCSLGLRVNYKASIVRLAVFRRLHSHLPQQIQPISLVKEYKFAKIPLWEYSILGGCGFKNRGKDRSMSNCTSNS